nr:endonuclease/exonuclease/phosphatase family protein [Jannaschia sp. S6380]
MMRDLRKGRDPQAEAALAVIAAARADIILLQDIDWDHGGLGLAVLVERLADLGADYRHSLALRPNSGTPSGHDLDGDGTTHEARDAMGYGWFTGDSGLALLSRLPLGSATDLSSTLWSDRSEAAKLLPPGARDLVPLATTAQWTVPIEIGGREATLITMAAGTPVFDGPEDRNGLRNRDELALVSELAADADLPIVLGRANLDPDRGQGIRPAITGLLTHPKLQDPVPTARDGRTETAFWDDPGAMRVDYVLPPAAAKVVGAGVLGDAGDDALAGAVAEAGTGRLVWVDIRLP